MRRAVVVLALVAGCSGDHPFSRAQLLGGRTVDAATLNRGRDVYQQYCRPCHGENGDGKGYSAWALRPPPRDLTMAVFKFGHVPAGSLPPDEELAKIVRLGLEGTAMRPWDVPSRELDALVQYLKTFSPRWHDEKPATAIALSPDPFGAAREKEAIALGEKLYHVKAQCMSCHPAYVTHEALWRLSDGNIRDFASEMYVAQPKDSEYCLEWKPGWRKLDERECALPVRLLPPDFLRDPLRSVHAGSELGDLYRTIASGIPGASMPTWKGALPEEELWALAYYMRSLHAERDTPAAEAMRARLTSAANLGWKPPAR
jgi:mono/diheme cytochrome c family protein